MTTTQQHGDPGETIPDPLNDWFRHVGTSLSREDYEDGIRAIDEHDKLLASQV